MSATDERPSRLAWLRVPDVLAAFGLLTCLPLEAPDPHDPPFGRAAPFLPLAGAIVGSALAAVDWLIAPSFPSLISAVMIVAVWEGLSRGGMRRVYSDSIGFTAGAAIGKVVVLALLPVPRLLPLFLAPLLGAWSVVVLAVGARDADTAGRKLAPGVLFNEFAIASLVTFALVFDLAEGLGILIVVTAAATLVALRFVLHEWIGGLSAPWLLRGSQLIELLTLALLIPFQS